MAGRYSHAEPPIVKHSTRTEWFIILIITSHDYNGISSNNCTVYAVITGDTIVVMGGDDENDAA